MINRNVVKLIDQKLEDNKVIVIQGPRQVGKTTLLKQKYDNDDTLWLNADSLDVRDRLSNPNISELRRIIGKATRVIVDEAQRVQNIGITAKLIYDEIPSVKLILTGSSALDLASNINEPLTGRKWEYLMYPLSISEMESHHGYMTESALLNQRLIYGMYPDVINHPGEERDILTQLADSAMYKDILTWRLIKKPQQLEKLVQALAYQIGSEVSYNELSQMVGLDNETVESYIHLLEKAYILFRLPALSRNLRNEIKKSKKIYFYDVGLRNAVINNWNPITMRSDVGGLWENFLIVERMKYKAYNKIYSNDYFWRTHAQQEIDYVEDASGVINAYEFKWNNNKKAKWSKTFLDAYPEHKTMLVSRENYWDFVTSKI